MVSILTFSGELSVKVPPKEEFDSVSSVPFVVLYGLRSVFGGKMMSLMVGWFLC